MTEPIIEEMPTKIRADEPEDLAQAGVRRGRRFKPWPAGMVTLARVGYEVQPEPAPPPSTKKLTRMMTKAGHMNQYDIMFSFGNGHVLGADHQRDQEVAERAGQQRNDDEEDHHRGVHGEEHVVEVGRHLLAPAPAETND